MPRPPQKRAEFIQQQLEEARQKELMRALVFAKTVAAAAASAAEGFADDTWQAVNDAEDERERQIAAAAAAVAAAAAADAEVADASATQAIVVAQEVYEDKKAQAAKTLQAFGKRWKWGKAAAEAAARRLARKKRRAREKSYLKGKSDAAIIKWFKKNLRLAKINLKTFLGQVGTTPGRSGAERGGFCELDQYPRAFVALAPLTCRWMQTATATSAWRSCSKGPWGAIPCG